MSSNISINSATQQVAAKSGSSARQSGKSDQADDKFSDHLADAEINKKPSNGLNEGGETTIDSELASEDAQLAEIGAQGAAETDVLEAELQEMSQGNLEISVENDNGEQADLKPVAADIGLPGDAAETVKETIVPIAVGPVVAGSNGNAVKSSSEGVAAKSVGAANAKNVAARRENLKVAQGEVENKDQSAGDADDGTDTLKPARTMERPLVRTVGRERANGMLSEQASNNNGAAKAERPANGVPNAFGVRGAEGRLASMMEASSAFDGDVKISMGKQENHMLPAMPQQLTVTGMSRTVVSQVLEMRQSSELDTLGLDAKATANKPVKFIEVQLMPRNLGAVGITIRNTAGRISISIEVQGAEAERLIKNEVDKIAGAIRQAGQVVEDITIKRGVQMSQQADSLSGDRGASRQGEANFGQNPGNPLAQSSRDETDGSSNPRRFDEIGIQESGKIAASSDKDARQGIYL